MVRLTSGKLLYRFVQDNKTHDRLQMLIFLRFLRVRLLLLRDLSQRLLITVMKDRPAK